MPIKSHIRCPSCQGPLTTTGLHCDSCDLSLTGRFPNNEFSSLGEDDLHFLRIFILTEGRIREMESALGVSYPTIKSRLAQLKTTLANASHIAPGSPGVTVPNTTAASTPNPTADARITTILQSLEAGRITFDQATIQLKNLQEKEG